MQGSFLGRGLCGALLACVVSAGGALADQPRGGSRDGAQWRTPPPAWGYAPGATPYSTFPRAAPYGTYRGDGYRNEQYRPDRQRWRDDPYDRHELNRYDDRRGGYDDGRGYRDRYDRRRERQGSIVRPYQPEGQRAAPESGPFAPRPRDEGWDHAHGRDGGYDDR